MFDHRNATADPAASAADQPPRALDPLRYALDRAVARPGPVDETFFETVAQLLRPLTESRDWLPPEASRAGSDDYQRHMLVNDPAGRYAIGSFVWAPGQRTPIHDHRGWGGIIAVLDGALLAEDFLPRPDGTLEAQPPRLLQRGQVAWVSAATGDIHRLGNPATAGNAISVHVYGCDFFSVCRNRYDERSGKPVPFVPPSPGPAAVVGQSSLRRP